MEFSQKLRLYRAIIISLFAQYNYERGVITFCLEISTYPFR